MRYFLILILTCQFSFSQNKFDRKEFAEKIRKVFALRFSDTTGGFKAQTEMLKLEDEFDNLEAFEVFLEEYEKAKLKPDLHAIGVVHIFIYMKPVEGRKTLNKIVSSEKYNLKFKAYNLFCFQNENHLRYWLDSENTFKILKECLTKDEQLTMYATMIAAGNELKQGESGIVTYKSFVLDFLDVKTVEEAQEKMNAILEKEKKSREILNKIDIEKLSPKEIDEHLKEWKKLNSYEKELSIQGFETLALKLFEQTKKNITGKYSKSLVKIMEHLSVFFEQEVEFPNNDFLKNIDDVRRWTLFYLRKKIDRAADNFDNNEGNLHTLKRVIEGYKLNPELFK